MTDNEIEDQANQIVKGVTGSGGIATYKEAEMAVMMFWLPDMSFHRGAITLALKKLENHFNKVAK